MSRQQEWEHQQAVQHQQQHQQQHQLHPDHPHHGRHTWGPAPQHQQQYPHHVGPPEYYDGYPYQAPPGMSPEERATSAAPRKQHRKTQSRDFLPPPLPPTIGNGAGGGGQGGDRAQSERHSPVMHFDPGVHRARSLAPNGHHSPLSTQQPLQLDQKPHHRHQNGQYLNGTHDQEFGHKRKRSEGYGPRGGLNGSNWGEYPANGPPNGTDPRHDPRAWSQPYEGDMEHGRRLEGSHEAGAGDMGPPALKKSANQQQKQHRTDGQQQHRQRKSAEEIKPVVASHRPSHSPVRQKGPPFVTSPDNNGHGHPHMPPPSARDQEEVRYPADPQPPMMQQQPQQAQLQRQRHQQAKGEEKVAKRQGAESLKSKQKQEVSQSARELAQREQLQAERHRYEVEAARTAPTGTLDTQAAAAAPGYPGLPSSAAYPASGVEQIRHRGPQAERGPALTAPPFEPEPVAPAVVALQKGSSQHSQYQPQQHVASLPHVPQQRIISDSVWAWFDEFESISSGSKENDSRPAAFLGSWLYEPWKQPLLPAGVLAGNVAALLEVRISGKMLGLYRERSDPAAPSGWTLGWRARQAGVRVDIQDGVPLGEESIRKQKQQNGGSPSFWKQGGLEERKVWGSEVYTDDSDVLAMCVHSGWIEGPAKVQLGPAFSNERLPGSEDNLLYSPPDLRVTLRVAPRLVGYRESCGGGFWSRSWLGMHDGVSLLVERVQLEKVSHDSRAAERPCVKADHPLSCPSCHLQAGSALSSSLPGARGPKNGAAQFASLQTKLQCLSLLDRAAELKASSEQQTRPSISILDSRSKSVFPLSEISRGSQGPSEADDSSVDNAGPKQKRFWWKVGDVVAQQLSATAAARFPAPSGGSEAPKVAT